MGSSNEEDTGKRRAIRALELSEQRFELLVDSVMDYAIFMLDPSGIVSSWNLGAERTKGYQEDEILGQHFSVFYPEEDREDGLPDELLRQAREDGRVEHAGWRVRKDGSRFWADVVITALFDDDGAHVGYAKVTRDMTSDHLAQVARDDALHHERRLVERLEEIDEWRRSFISAVTHDLQTPVSAIAGFAQILREEDVTEGEVQDFLGRIESNAKALEGLIDHLRTFSSLEEGRIEIAPAALDLDAEVTEVVDGMQPVLDGRQVQIETRGLEVAADRQGLRRILQNLLSNAARHSSTATTIVVRARRQDGSVVVEVEDEGEGISADVLPSVFERYESGRRGGTGLGLWIVRQYVELHGGSVDVDSVKGEGTTFRLTLPAA